MNSMNLKVLLPLKQSVERLNFKDFGSNPKVVVMAYTTQVKAWKNGGQTGNFFNFNNFNESNGGMSESPQKTEAMAPC